MNPPGHHPVLTHARRVAGLPATIAHMPEPHRKMTFKERAQAANAARRAKATEEEMSAAARRAAQGAHTPVALARRILRAWRAGKISQADLDEIRDILTHIEGLFPRRSR